MKLIIDIPEKNFIKDDLIHFFGCYSQKLDEVIKNGTPLDNLRAEIEEQKECRCFDDDDMYIYKTGLNDAIDIIDKYRNEVSKE